MRDWLACPLSPTTSVHTKSDEGATTDDDYAFVNPESSSELDLTEEEEEEETSTWLSVLSILGVSKKMSRKKASSYSSSSSSSSLNTTTLIEVKSTEKEHKESKMEYLETKTEEEEDTKAHEDEGVHLYQIPMDQSCNNNIVPNIESDHPILTPVSLQMGGSTIISPRCIQEYSNSTKTIKICWNHGGKKVQITGEFDNWSKPIDMVPDNEQDSRYHIHLPLTLDKDMEFKFMVDGEWRYAKDLPHRTDKNGNINNVIYMESACIR